MQRLDSTPTTTEHKRGKRQTDEGSDVTSKRSRSNPSDTLPSLDFSLAPLTPLQAEQLLQAQAYAREWKPTAPIEKPADLISLHFQPHAASGVDIRTLSVLSRIYVGSIHFDLNDSHLKAVFGQFGVVKTISLSIDHSTMRHKGFCFVEFDTPEAASLAVAKMHGADLGGRQLKVGRPNNYSAAAAVAMPVPPPGRFYVANINTLISQENMESIFEAFGKLKSCVLLPDAATRNHKGYGFIEFEANTAAKAAMEAMNNFEMGGQPLRVGPCIVGGPLGEGMRALALLPIKPVTPVDDVMSKVNANILSLGINKKIEAPLILKPRIEVGEAPLSTMAQLVQEQVRAQSSLVDSVDKEENISINSRQRYAIMQKLAASREEMTTILLVQNAVKASEVDEGLGEEFSEECSKYGLVRSVKVQSTLDESKVNGLGGKETGREEGDGDVKIFVEFGSTQASSKAFGVLDGRWFGGRQLKATLLSKAAVEKYDL
ncbi:hypothetical protein BDF14DRAFT_1741663 [Spinellus fusiger]|nr:hypothetical protein BDF14DRAFT_1741663 [Spinellus fusiger]